MGRRYLVLAMLTAAAGCSQQTDPDGNEVANIAATGAPDAGPANLAAAGNDEAPANIVVPLADNVIEADAKKENMREDTAKIEEEVKKTPAAEVAETGKSGDTPVATADVTPPASFGRCAVCHDVKKGGPDRLGPNLYGTYGKPAGSHGGFAYSDALKNSGLKWDDATLDKWLDSPRALVPGNRMSFPGLKDPAKRKEIIAFIQTLK